MIGAVLLTHPRCAEEAHVAAVEAPRDEAAPLGALDLPLPVAVWEDGSQTKVSYPSPAEVARRYGLDADLAGALHSTDTLIGAVVNR
jgi:hypothetical protein